MKVVARTAVLLMLAGLISSALARELSLADLKAKAESAKPADQPKLFIEIARRQLDMVDKQYKDGQSEQAQASLKEVVGYSERAGKASTESGKHLKSTEIEVRKMTQRLKDMKPTVSFDDRPPIQDAIDQLEHVSDLLFKRMFGS
jgi:hypothetical protein